MELTDEQASDVADRPVKAMGSSAPTIEQIAADMYQVRTIEAERYRASRGETWCKIFDTLRKHRCSSICDEDGAPYPLVDAMSSPGRTIASGEMEMVSLADEISIALGLP